MTIFAVGAAGKFAGLVIPALAQRGASVRGLIRNPTQAERVRNNGATEIAVGDLADPASLDRALQGVEAVFYVAPAFLPDEARWGRTWWTPLFGRGCAGSCFRQRSIRC